MSVTMPTVVTMRGRPFDGVTAPAADATGLDPDTGSPHPMDIIAVSRQHPSRQDDAFIKDTPEAQTIGRQKIIFDYSKFSALREDCQTRLSLHFLGFTALRHLEKTEMLAGCRIVRWRIERQTTALSPASNAKELP
jgi:hypothetical protein